MDGTSAYTHVRETICLSSTKISLSSTYKRGFSARDVQASYRAPRRKLRQDSAQSSLERIERIAEGGVSSL